MEQFVNDPGTTITSNVLSGDATIHVASGTGYPSSGDFRIKINNELMLVTAVTGLTWSVTRGIEGTSAAGHTSGDAVNHYLTAGGLTVILTESNVLNTTTQSTTYAMSNTDFMVRGNTTAGTFTVTLPTSPTTGQIAVIKKMVAANTLNVASAADIDGTSPVALTSQYAVLRVQFSGTTWDVW